MKRFFKGMLTASMFVSALGYTSLSHVSAVEKEESYTQYVDPFVCTDVDYGQLFPGSVVPNGLVKLSPDTYPHETLDHAGYDYSKLQIQGFSHTRIEGVGGQGAGGDVLVTPTYVQYTAKPSASSKAMSYTKEDENAKPGYYSVALTPNTGKDGSVSKDTSIGKIKAELTTDQRTGFHKYTFPKAGNINLLVDLAYTYDCRSTTRNAILDVLEQSDQTTALVGRFSASNVGGSGRYTLYFYMETSKPVKDIKTWNGDTLTNKLNQKGNDLGAILNFDVEDNEELQLKVSISPISVKQAKIDMHKEISDWNFDAAYQRADKQWNDVLGKIRVESSAQSDPTGELKKLFYTHLYHMFMTPVNATSTSGTYRGNDGLVHEADDYTHYDSWTLWDDYRKYPMIGLVMPDVYKDMVRSIADALEYGMATWSHNNQSVPNVRTEHAVALLADGVAKGFVDIDNLEKAYEEAKKIANKVITPSVEEKGYVSGRMDRTMEYAYDDWALSIIADALGKDDEAAYFLNRSQMYKNLFRKDAIQDTTYGSLGLIWNKNADGSWSTSDPTKIGADGLYQGSMWQYTWYDSNDVNGLMDLMGGKENMLKALQYMFGEQDPDNPKAMLHDATNEVELHLPYLFNFAGRPDKTQYWIRQIYTDKTWNTGYASGTKNEKQQMYKLDPQGYLLTMDDDAGTMAMMFVSAAMGIYAMTPGDTTFQIGTPFFDKISLDVGNGKTFTIVAHNVSKDRFYIQSATFNGQSFNRTWLDYSEITKGGVLEFEMGSEPSSWAQDSVPACSSSDLLETTYNNEITYSSSMLEESSLNDGSIEKTLTMTLENDEAFRGEIGDDLVKNKKIKVSHVPDGLTASAIITAQNTVEVSLEGKAKNHKLNDSIGNLTVMITKEATTLEKEMSKDNIKVMFKDDRLSYSTTTFKESESNDGSIIDTATITLTGTSQFAGQMGENFVETGKAVISQIPEGLTAKMIKTGENTIVLSFEGQAQENDIDVEFALSFTDDAFKNAKASEVEGSACSSMTALVLDFTCDKTVQLKKIVSEAALIKSDGYTTSSYATLQDAIKEGKDLLDQKDLSDKDIQDTCKKITSAMESLKISVDGLTRLEAGLSDDRTKETNEFAPNDPVLKTEGDNLGGTFNGAWIRYDGLDFTGLNITSIDVTYSAHVNRCSADGRLEVWIDGKNEEDGGILLITVSMPTTGTSWSNFVTSNAAIDFEKAAKLEGIHNVYFVMKGTTSTSLPFIANIDDMQFKEDEQEESMTSIRLEGEKSNEMSSDKNPYKPSDPVLKNETNNLGGTFDGAWVSYKDVDFKNLNANIIKVRYGTRNDVCVTDGYIEVRENDKEGTLLGTVYLTQTGGWSTFKTATARLNTTLSGKQTICFVLRGSTSTSRPHIANIDYFEFEKDIVSQRLEAEDKNNWSGGALKTETSKDAQGNSLTNVGGTYAGAWLEYDAINFDTFDTKDISIRYVNNSGRCKPDSQLVFYLDSMENDPICTIAIPATGNAWSAYQTITKSLGYQLTGTHDLYVVMKGTQGSNPYICNLDWIEFGVNEDLQEGEEVDKSELKTLFDEHKAILQQVDKYHDIGFNIFKDKILSADQVLDDKKATKRDVMVAIKDINNAIKTLQYQIIFDLNDLINDMDEVASSITEANYTKESYQSFIDDFTSGKTVLEKAKQQETEAIYQECLKAYDDLKEAFSQLTLLNRDQLAALIEKAENIDLDAYVDEGQDELKAALKKAKDIYQSVSLSQKEVDDVYKELDEAMNKLVKCADKSLLQELVDKINGLDKDKYVSETWMELEKELENSQVVLDDKNISQEKVDEAYVSLQKAYENLKEKTSNEEIKIEDPEETGEKGESSNEGNVSTGDQTTIGLYVGIAIISLLGIIMIMKKKRA